MTPAFLTPDVCRALVAAGYPQTGDDWWGPNDRRMLLEGVPYSTLKATGCVPAVTPLQALDWLVMSGRIEGWEGGTECWCAWWPQRPYEIRVYVQGKDGRNPRTPEALVRAVLGMEVAA